MQYVTAVNYYLLAGLTAYAGGLGGFFYFKNKRKLNLDSLLQDQNQKLQNVRQSQAQRRLDTSNTQNYWSDAFDRSSAALQSWRVAGAKYMNELKKRDFNYWASYGCLTAGFIVGTYMISKAQQS